MNEKKPVYHGYEEHYFTGQTLKYYFDGQYYATGRHHSLILGITIPEYLNYLGVDDTTTYRVFLNSFFCRLMHGETDSLIAFFGYHSLGAIVPMQNPAYIHLPKSCPKCGVRLHFKEGKYGAFLGCSQYPMCKYTKNIPVIGNSH